MERKRARAIGRSLAIGGSLLAVIFGYFSITWIFLPYRPTAADYMGFIVSSSLLAVVGALPGLLIGSLLSLGNNQKGTDA